MNKSIPTELYNSIISQVNIVDIISNFVSLSKKGNNYVGLCPFHQDSSPSFMVNPTKNIYKCFPCGKGGDAIKFLRDKENMSFIQSLEYIANQLGMDVNFEEFKNNSNFTSKYNETELELLEILKAANAFYKTQLIKNQDAINYLKHRQIYQSDIIDKFDIGFAPDNNSLSNYLITKLNYSPEQLLKVGLINDTGNELFRNRIMFGIRNSFGEIVGFSGRILHKENLPKYINTSETIFFNKSKLLYNYHNFFEFSNNSNEIIIVEGYLDVIACYQADIFNVVALMGTSLTKEHLYLLKNKKIKLFLDNDNAGLNATLKTLKFLLSNNINNIEVIRNPYEKDADEILKEHGKDILIELINSSKIAIEWIYNSLKNILNVNQNSDINTIKTLANEFTDYLNYYDNDIQNYFKNKFLSDYKYELKVNSYIDDNTYLNNSFISSNDYAFDIYGQLPQNTKNIDKDEFLESINELKRLRFLMFMIMNNDFSNLFLEDENCKNLFTQPEEIRDLFIKVRSFNKDINDKISQNIYENFQKAYENINIENKIKELKSEVLKTFIKIKKQRNANELTEKFNEFWIEKENEINNGFQEQASIPLFPIVIEAKKEYNNFVLEVGSVNPKTFSNYINSIEKYKNIKIKLEKR